LYRSRGFAIRCSDVANPEIPATSDEARLRVAHALHSPADFGPLPDPDLNCVIDAWPMLPEAIKAAMLALARMGNSEGKRK
jgi:hypothetical protein